MSKIVENSHKVAYLIQQYPEHKLEQIIGLIQMPAVDINAAIWHAIDTGLISDPDPETGASTFLKEPKKWQFGETVDQLKETLVYAFQKLAKKESDLEENYLNSWLQGYTAHDELIVMKTLLNDHTFAEYMIEDGDSQYTFYTLYENRDKLWGRAQFKKDPLNDKVGGNAEEPAKEEK